MPIVLQPDTLSTLVSTDRATQNATLAALEAQSPSALASLLAAATGAIQRYCKRSFFQQAVTEYYDGGGMPYQLIQLREFPVASIDRIAARPRRVITFQVTDQTTYQRATVQTTGTVIRLTTVASAVKTVNDIDTATYTTLSAVATHANTLAGWTCTVETGFGSFPSADLRFTQGAFDARNNPASLEMWTEELPNYSFGPWGSYGCHGWRCDTEAGEVKGHFPQGVQNIRVDYTAGFSSIPDPVQEACVQLACDLYNSGVRDQTQSSGSIGEAGFSNIRSFMSPKVRSILDGYRDYSKDANR